jgi:hypothetical protein
MMLLACHQLRTTLHGSALMHAIVVRAMTFFAEGTLKVDCLQLQNPQHKSLHNYLVGQIAIRARINCN